MKKPVCSFLFECLWQSLPFCTTLLYFVRPLLPDCTRSPRLKCVSSHIITPDNAAAIPQDTSFSHHFKDSKITIPRIRKRTPNQHFFFSSAFRKDKISLFMTSKKQFLYQIIFIQMFQLLCPHLVIKHSEVKQNLLSSFTHSLHALLFK